MAFTQPSKRKGFFKQYSYLLFEEYGKITCSMHDTYTEHKDVLNKICSLPHLSQKEEEITAAYIFTREAHTGQNRVSGEDYILHCLRTAFILAQMRMPENIVIVGILHDTLEDTDVTREDLQKHFGEEIAFLVYGVSILGPVKYIGFKKSKHSIQKLFMCSTKDMRVLFIKLADRLDNMRTLHIFRSEKQQRLAQETKTIYVPIAQKLGLGIIYLEMNDLCLKYIDPEKYNILKKQIDAIVDSKKMETCVKSITHTLKKGGVGDFVLQDRIKSVSSTLEKLKNKEKKLDEIHDLMGVRILVHTLPECYIVLGMLHNKGKFLEDRLKDYIATPKPNGYRSIHTQIIFENTLVDIQIRTNTMHEHAEHGVASHFTYKKQDKWLEENFPKLTDKTKNWIQEINDMASIKASQKYLQKLQGEYLNERIFVYTEKKDVIELSKEATVLDFAYIIHPDIGKNATGAWVNDKYKKLETVLNYGDVIKIQTGKNIPPNKKHLRIVQTKEGINKVKRLLRKNNIS